jgi:hypothetical protein
MPKNQKQSQSQQAVDTPPTTSKLSVTLGVWNNSKGTCEARERERESMQECNNKMLNTP